MIEWYYIEQHYYFQAKVVRGDKNWREADSEVEEEMLEVKTNPKDTICSSCDTKKYPQ